MEARPPRDERERAALHRLYALYLHDLAEFGDHYRLDEEARWQPYYLDDMLGRDDCECLLIKAAELPVGFALVGRRPFPHMAPEADLILAEFFVARPYRGRGLGREAAQAVVAGRGGLWQLRVLPANEPALAFWRRVLPGAEVVELPDDVVLWHRT